MEKKLNNATIHVLKKMCSYVNADFKKIDFKKERWFMEYQWDPSQEEDFISWLSNEILTDNKLRKSLSSMPYRPSKKRARKFAEYFNMMYGWKTKITE